ncbi:MAG: sortase, partial [Actinomycetota bacterium]|nr:sortase [Actinomycetota bacterium]
TTEARLTLTTCTPRFTAQRRLVVSAVLTETPAPAPTTTTSTTAPAESGVSPPPTTPPKLEQPGLSGDPTARWPTLWWGLLATTIGILTYLASRRWRAFWAYLAGTPVFLVVLFIFFENVSRLLPANI